MILYVSDDKNNMVNGVFFRAATHLQLIAL